MTDSVLPLLQRWSLFTGVLLLIGILVWRIAIAPRVARADEGSEAGGVGFRDLEGRASRLARAVTLALLPVWLLRLHVQLHDFRDPFAPLLEDLDYLVRETLWGGVWVAQGVLLLGLAGLFHSISRRVSEPASHAPQPAERWSAPPEGDPRADGSDLAMLPWRWKAGAWGGVFLVLTLSLSSHAMAVPYNRPLAVAVDGAHTIAAGGWLGTLALLLFLFRGGPRTDMAFAAQLRAFSPVALVCVGVLVFMGGVLAIEHLSEFRNLWASSWGRVLAAKILLAGCVMALGAWNWRRGLPALSTEEGRKTVFRRAAVETGLGCLVLLVTAVLVATSMPEGTH